MRETLSICLLAACFAACSDPATQADRSPGQKAADDNVAHRESGQKSAADDMNSADTWDQRAAAAYLDQRADWWMGWQGAARDHQTFCVSCHTAVPYALSRAVLRKTLGEEAPSVNERRLIDNVAKRVRLWKEVEPFYTDDEYGAHKSSESRGTESVLDALILANYDAQNGGRLSEDTRGALENMWALQQATGDERGAWPWLQFDLAPWEASDSRYYGAALAALAVGTAPDNYRSIPEIRNNMELLSEYLGRHYGAQDTLNRIFLLWASTKVPGLLDAERRESIVREILSKQQADGGWSLSSLSGTWRSWNLSSFLRRWKRADGTLQEVKADGYATGLIIFVLKQAGIPAGNAHLKQGRIWLIQNQDKAQGLWVAYSLNKRRPPYSNVGRFMSDSATAYAVLGLAQESGLDQMAPPAHK
jgi:squalene-hopene/tetraprenyl-beta-curcumene cyclase